MTEEQKSACSRMMRVLARARKEVKIYERRKIFSIPQGEEERFLMVRSEGQTCRFDIYPSAAVYHGYMASQIAMNTFFDIPEVPDFFNPHVCVRFVGKEESDPDQREAYVAVKLETGKRPTGSKAYPLVTYWDGRHAPAAELSAKDMDMVSFVLDVLLKAAAVIPDLYYQAWAERFEYVRLQPEGDGFAPSVQRLPIDSVNMTHPVLSRLDQEKLAKATGLPKKGEYFSCFLPVTEQVLLPDDPQKVYPFVWYFGELKDTDNPPEEKDCRFLFTTDPEGDKEKLLEELLDFFLKRGSLPETISYWADDLYGRCLLRGLCRKLQIHFLSQLKPGSFWDDINDFVYSYRLQMMESAGPCSYVIRAELSKKCWRDIRISGKETYGALAIAIVKAFDFDMDHLFEFTLPQVSDEDSFTGSFFPSGDEEWESANMLCLMDSDLKEGLTFRFLYDFGDRWLFSCKVLKVLSEETEGSWQIIGEKGKAPEQYPEW